MSIWRLFLGDGCVMCLSVVRSSPPSLREVSVAVGRLYSCVQGLGFEVSRGSAIL